MTTIECKVNSSAQKLSMGLNFEDSVFLYTIVSSICMILNYFVQPWDDDFGTSMITAELFYLGIMPIDLLTSVPIPVIDIGINLISSMIIAGLSYFAIIYFMIKEASYASYKASHESYGDSYDSDDPEDDFEDVDVQNDTEPDITRMDEDREIVIGFWSGGRSSHASLFLCYFSEIMQQGLVGRVFAIELFIRSNNEIYLSIKGPLYGTRGYDCKEFYLIYTNMNEVIEIAKQTINEHGSYKYWTNNCRTFASKCLENIKSSLGGKSFGITASDMNKYIRKYVKRGKCTSALEDGYATVEEDEDEESSVKTLSFIEVLRKYPLD